MDLLEYLHVIFSFDKKIFDHRSDFDMIFAHENKDDNFASHRILKTGRTQQGWFAISFFEWQI